MNDIFSARSQTGHDLPGFLTPDGMIRLLAALPNRARFEFTPFAAENPVIPRSEWAAFARVRTDVPILNQGSTGSCNPHGFTSANMRARSAAGEAFALLSAPYLYAQINGGQDAGSAPEDAAQALITTGECLDSEVPEGFYTLDSIPASANATAARFRADPKSFYEIGSFDELVSAILLGFKCPFTVRVAGNWNNFDANGSPPFYRGPGNHVTCDDDSLAQLPSGEWVIPARNSWGASWGNNGRYHFREAGVDNQPGFVAYAMKFPGEDPLDPNLVPAAN